MSKKKNTDSVNWRERREAAGLTLQNLSALSGYSVPTINGLELNGEGSARLRQTLAEILLSPKESVPEVELEHWRNRAKAAENRVENLLKKLRGILTAEDCCPKK